VIKLPFKKHEVFPEEFLALDLGGKLLKAFLFKTEGDYVRLLGARKAPRGEDPEVALKEIIEDLKSDFPDLPKTAVVGVSGPFTSAFTTVVRSSLAKNAGEITTQAREAARRQAQRRGAARHDDHPRDRRRGAGHLCPRGRELRGGAGLAVQRRGHAALRQRGRQQQPPGLPVPLGSSAHLRRHPG